MARPKKVKAEDSENLEPQIDLDALEAVEEASEEAPVVEVGQPKDGEFVKVFILSQGVETIEHKGKKCLKVNANSEDYYVPLNEQVEIPARFYGCVSGIIERQNA